MISLLAITGSGYFQASGDQVGALDFVGIMIDFQDLIVLPMLVMVYMCSMSLYQEFHGRQIYLFKDISRVRVLHGKYVSLLNTYLLFFVMYAVCAIGSYYAIFQFTAHGNGQWVALQENVMPLVFDAFQILLTQLLYIHIGFSFALRFSTGVSIFGTLLCYLFLKTTPYITWARYLTPAGYREVYQQGNHSLAAVLFMSVAVWVLYNAVLYLLNRRAIQRMDFS